jgi:hypothetical protein
MFPCRKSIENMGNHLHIEIYIGKSEENMGNHNQKEAMIREIWQIPSFGDSHPEKNHHPGVVTTFFVMIKFIQILSPEHPR